MDTLSLAAYLGYANLQMAAEAIIRDPISLHLAASGDELKAALVRGNTHASRFTEAQANEFVDPDKGWRVLDQAVNTSTGFSGTLFTNNETGELVLSFRSTEFIDDAVRDNMATNELEIKKAGWAWGQLADMEAWYGRLKDDPAMLGGKHFSVTGYSLGGHLATAFNLLHGAETLADGSRRIDQVVTFNGAGVGKIKAATTLADVLGRFAELRGSTEGIVAALSEPELKALYRTLAARTYQTAEAVKAAQAEIMALYPAGGITREGLMVWQALNEIYSQSFGRDGGLLTEIARLPTLKEGGSGANAGRNPEAVPADKILATDLNYRMAVRIVSAFSETAALSEGASRAYQGKANLSTPGLAPQFDVVGDTTPSAVANSLWHYGQDVRVFIEDQPLIRGQAFSSMVKASFADFAIRLLVDRYYYSDFGDTHSLVLIADTLAVENALLTLAPGGHNACRAEYLGNQWRITA